MFLMKMKKENEEGMKCYKCNVNIESNTHICPLCKNEIKKEKVTSDVFPIIPIVHKGHGLFLKILALIFLINTITCIAINLMITKRLSWSLIVLAGNICVALTLMIAIKKRHHFAKLIFSEYFLITVGTIIWDYATGWHCWSLDYVLPLVSMIFIYISFILRLFFPYQLRNYLMNLVFACVVGIIPMFLLMFDVTSTKWPAYASAITSIVMFCSLLIFDGKKIKKELESRFHV